MPSYFTLDAVFGLSEKEGHTLPTTIVDIGQNLEMASKIFRLLSAGGLHSEVIHVILNDRAARIRLIQFANQLAKSSERAPSYQRARDILGDDFVSPQEIAKVCFLTYSEETLAHLSSSLPEKEVLQWARDNDFMVVAGPPSEMSLLDIRNLDPQLFWSRSGGWFAKHAEEFARRDKIDPGWLILRKAPVPNSTRKTWKKQLELLSDNERVPNVAEVVWGFTTYAKIRGTRLVPDAYVRTSSVDSSKFHVDIGIFSEGGLLVLDWAGVDHSDIGVSASRKF